MFGKVAEEAVTFGYSAEHHRSIWDIAVAVILS